MSLSCYDLLVTKGLVATTLRNCTQLLEMLQVLGVDTGNVVLEKKILECVKERALCGGEIVVSKLMMMMMKNMKLE